MTLVRSLTLSCLLLSASAAFANDSQFVGVYELKGSYADAQNTSLADSTIKLTVKRERGRLTFTRTSAIPTGPHQSLLPVSWESKRVQNRGQINNDQGSYHHLEVTYSVTVREARGASGALNGAPSSGRRTQKDLVLNYYFPSDDLTSVGELGTNTIKHGSPPQWETLKSFGNKTAAAPPAATTSVTRPSVVPRAPIAPPTTSRYDRDGYDRYGYDRSGFDRYGNHFQNRGHVRGYVPQPGVVIGTNRSYPYGSNYRRNTTTTFTPNGSITRSSTYRSNSRGGISFGGGGVRINIPLGR